MNRVLFCLALFCQLLPFMLAVTAGAQGDWQAGAGVGSRVPSDAVMFRGHHYKFYFEKLIWKDAKKACEDKGGHLVTFGNAAEREFVLQTTNLMAKSCWIGLAAEKWQQRKFPETRKAEASKKVVVKIGAAEISGTKSRRFTLEGVDFRWVDGKVGLSLWEGVLKEHVQEGDEQYLYVHLGIKGADAQWSSSKDDTMPYICEWDY